MNATLPPSASEAFFKDLERNAPLILAQPEKFCLSAPLIKKGENFRKGILETLQRSLMYAETAQSMNTNIHKEEGYTRREKHSRYQERIRTAISEFEAKYFTDKYTVIFSMMATLLDKNESRKAMFIAPQRDQTFGNFLSNMFHALDHPASFFDLLQEDYGHIQRKLDNQETPPAAPVISLNFQKNS